MGKKSRRSKAKAPSSAAAPAAQSTTVPSAAARAADTGGGVKFKAADAGVAKKKKAATSSSRRTTAGNLLHPFQPTPKSELDAIKSPRVVSSNEMDPEKAPAGSTCWICLEGAEDGNDEPLRRDCACRGDQFAHLSCMVECFTSKSEDIWCGRMKAAEGTMELAFAWPWESCSICKKYFSGKLRLDLAREFARSTEGMMGGVRAFRHITAVNWVTKSLSDSRGKDDYDMNVREFEKCLQLVKESYPVYEPDSSQEPCYNTVLQYIHSHVQQAEGELQCNYAMSVCVELMRTLERNQSSVSEQRKLYDKWHRLITSSMACFEGLKTTGLGIGAPQQIESCLLQLRTNHARWKKEFARRGFRETKPAQGDEDEVLLSERLMNAKIREKGEMSSEAILYALTHVQVLCRASDRALDWKPFTALDLMVKTYRKSTLSLGPMHDYSKQLLYHIGSLTIQNQMAAFKYDPDMTFCPVDRYEEDCDIYIVGTQLLAATYGEGIGETNGWDPSDVILQRGALVKCVDLLKASHLNGKRGYVWDFDETHGRHLVNFEDVDTKPCLVKPGNLRLLFWEGEDYRAGRRAYEDLKKSKADVGGSKSAPPAAQSECKDDVDDREMPDLC